MILTPPTISIIIPAWNNPHELAQCLASLERQTFRDFDVTVVDDGSVPPIEPQPAGRELPVRLIRQTHAGAPAARNRGARETSSELLMFCDADAELRPNSLERLATALDAHPEASYAYSGFRFGWKVFRGFPFDANRLRQMPYIHTTSLMRRAHFPGFDESLRRFQDWDLYLTMLERGHIGTYIPDILMTMRSGGTMSRWLPKVTYRIPWRRIGWMPRRVRTYEDAAARIRMKHGLSVTPRTT